MFWAWWSLLRLLLQKSNSTVVQLLPEWDIPSIPINVVYSPNWHLSVKGRSFVDWAADLFTKHAHLQ